jgi:hypothetical protein
LGSKIRRPFGFGPKASAETIVHVPTKSFADWPIALLEQSASPKAVTVEKLITLRLFIAFLLRLKPYTPRYNLRFEAHHHCFGFYSITFSARASGVGKIVSR